MAIHTQKMMETDRLFRTKTRYCSLMQIYEYICPEQFSVSILQSVIS